MSLLRSFPKISGRLLTLAACAGIALSSGCEQPPSSVAATATAANASATGGGPLEEVLDLAEAGDRDAAIERFIHHAPANWVESASLEEFQLSEADFEKLGRSEKSRLQAQFIDRVQDIKTFSRLVVDKALEAKKRGDAATAEKYVRSVNRLGEQLRDADVVLVFQQTGKALAGATLED